MSDAHPGTQGYAEHASELLTQWAALDVEASCAPIARYLHAPPGRALDIGVGAGNTSAYLALRGWEVTSTEPTDALRAGAMRRHAGFKIRWLDDALPALPSLRAGVDRFDLVLGLAVLMHLDPDEQRVALVNMAALTGPGRSYPTLAAPWADASRTGDASRLGQKHASACQADWVGMPTYRSAGLRPGGEPCGLCDMDMVRVPTGHGVDQPKTARITRFSVA